MKNINQKDGSDLDPNDSSLNMHRKKEGSQIIHTPIQIEAVLKTTCSKCGGQGHLVRTI